VLALFFFSIISFIIHIRHVFKMKQIFETLRKSFDQTDDQTETAAPKAPVDAKSKLKSFSQGGEMQSKRLSQISL
jgi:hypothetical protein